MVYINTLLVTLVILFSLVGCGRSGITYLPQSLSIQLDESQNTLQTTLLKQKLENYNNLYVNKRILRLNDGSLVVYEEAITDDLYEFENTTTWIVSEIFDAKKLYKLYSNNHLYAFQLVLPNRKILNLIAQQDDTQELKLIYGMRSKKLKQILKKLDNNAKDAYYHDVITIEDASDALWSRWSVTKVHFTPLITPLRYLGGP